MKKQYTTPEFDVRKYEITEMIAASQTDDGDIDVGELL